MISRSDFQTALLRAIVGKSSDITSQLAKAISNPGRAFVVAKILNLVPGLASAFSYLHAAGRFISTGNAVFFRVRCNGISRKCRRDATGEGRWIDGW